MSGALLLVTFVRQVCRFVRDTPRGLHRCANAPALRIRFPTLAVKVQPVECRAISEAASEAFDEAFGVVGVGAAERRKCCGYRIAF